MTGRVGLGRATRIVARVPALTLIGVIQLYRYTVSPMTGPTCKYYPSCSTYAVQALERRGLFAGLALIAWRLLRCNPWSHGGVDDVPGPGEALFHRHRQTSPATS